MLPTLAEVIGFDLPTDRVYDGVDQTEFLFGKSEESVRESVVIYIGNVIFGVKWCNWKLLLRELDEDTYAIREMA